MAQSFSDWEIAFFDANGIKIKNINIYDFVKSIWSKKNTPYICRFVFVSWTECLTLVKHSVRTIMIRNFHNLTCLHFIKTKAIAWLQLLSVTNNHINCIKTLKISVHYGIVHLQWLRPTAINWFWLSSNCGKQIDLVH